MRTKHHRVPKWAGGLNKRDNIHLCSRREHHAWNVLTNNSQLSLDEIAEKLSKFIDPQMRFRVVCRGHEQLHLPM